MNCIFDDYMKFIDNFLSSYFRILLANKYERSLVRPFIDKYISIRYYNEFVIKENKFTERLNKELNSIAKEMIKENEDKSEKIKNIFALFSYVLFIEKCETPNELNSLIKTLFSDNTITLVYNITAKEELTALLRNFLSKKQELSKVFTSNEFSLNEKKYQGYISVVTLDQNCNLSKLYSEYAIEKAYNSEMVNENKLYLSLLLISYRVIDDITKLNFKNEYVVDFPTSLFGKQKKILKYLRVLDNEFLKSKVNLKLKYKEYKENKKTVNKLINEGFSICVELDESYDMDFDCLLLFSYIFVNKNAKYYDIIINSREDIGTEIVVL